MNCSIYSRELEVMKSRGADIDMGAQPSPTWWSLRYIFGTPGFPEKNYFKQQI